MRPNKRIGYIILTPVLALLAASGCFSDLGVTLLVSPGTLDFGKFEEEAALQVSKNATSTNMGPVVVTSNSPWIIPERCADGTFDCYSFGPRDQIEIPVRLDRGKMPMGMNTGALTLNARGASIQKIEVKAEKILDANFSANQRRINIGGSISFSNQSITSAESGAITSYLWNFGDGSSSTQPNPTHIYSTPGYYTVSLMVESESASDTYTRNAYIVVGDSPPRTVDFTADRTILYAGQSVQFTDMSEPLDGSPIESWHWDFGFGATSTQQNPRQQFPIPGAFNITLTVKTAFTERSVTKERFILVQDRIAPQADFIIEEPLTYVGDPVYFTDLSFTGNAQVSQRLWRFGDGTTSIAQNPTHVYQTAGTFEVTLAIATAFGSSSTTKSVVVRHKPPTAEFEVSTRTPSTGEIVQFTDLSSPGSSPITNWFWSFGDGATSTDRMPTHAYANAGTYTVSLRVFNQNPQSNTDVEVKFNYIQVFAPPIPAFDIELPDIPARHPDDNESILITDDVQFINQTLPGTEANISYAWSFLSNPEVVQSTAENPVYRFTQPGNYTVYLTATTATQQVTVSREVAVNQAPTPNFTATPRNSFDGAAITFTNTSTLPIGPEGNLPFSAINWNFGDGSTSTQNNPVYAYSTAGAFDVSLTIAFIHTGSGQTLSYAILQSNYINIEVAPTNLAVVDTLNDVLDGDTSNIANLNRDRGADGRISLREALLAAGNTGEAVTISFAVNGTISVQEMLPDLRNFSGGITIRGEGNVAIDGSLLSGLIPGLIIVSPDNLIQGLDIVNFPGPGIYLAGSMATDNRIQGCLIGTNGTNAMGNDVGVYIENASNNLVGGSENNAGNVISGNTTNGVLIFGTQSSGNQISGNLIGLNLSGTSALPNGKPGIALLSGARNNLIGGTTLNEGNIISGNKEAGIEINGSQTQDNLIINCYIGINITGAQAVGNDGAGVHIRGGAQNTYIGGTEEGEWNLISGNLGSGILIDGVGTSGTIIRNAVIGADIEGNPGNQMLGNQEHGISVVNGASNHQILGMDAAMRNIIAGNQLYGVHAAGANTSAVTISENIIFDNTMGGILLEDGANNNIAAPLLMGSNPVNGTAPAGSTVEIFVGAGNQGEQFVESVEAFGGFFSGTTDMSEFAGMNITATATDANGNTSEFSGPVTITSP